MKSGLQKPTIGIGLPKRTNIKNPQINENIEYVHLCGTLQYTMLNIKASGIANNAW